MDKHDGVTEQTGCGSPDCASAKRNRFFRGKHMKAEEFQAEQDYLVGRRRLINRAVLGWGVVEGLGLKGPRRPCAPKSVETAERSSDPPQPIEVQAGFALDRQGREIVLEGPATLSARNTFLRPSRGGCHPRPFDEIEPEGRYLLAVHYAERRSGDAGLPDGCGCDRPEKNFVCETAVFSLTPLEKCECPCWEPTPRGCVCGPEPCCHDCGGRHACLCQWVNNASVAPAEPLCEWNGQWIDASGGVALACVVVAGPKDKCDPTAVGWIEDDCGPRRLVKGNELLFDLWRGRDLVRIEKLSWDDWDRSEKPVSWDDFARRLQATPKDQPMTGFEIKFSGPVQEESLKRTGVIVMTVFTAEQPTGWRIPRRVPLAALDLTPDKTGGALPPGTTNRARLTIRQGWLRDEVDANQASWLSHREFLVEIEIRGGRLRGCHGSKVDVDGDGVPGGNLVTTFRVTAKPIVESPAEAM